MQHSPDRDGADLHLDEVFSDPAFAALKARCAAFAVVDPAERSVVWANAAAARHWDAADLGALSRALFGAEATDGGGWLDGLLQGLLPGRAPRLARGGLARGFRMRARTAMVRAFATPGAALLVGFAVPDAMSSDDAAAEDWRCPAWPTASPDASAAQAVSSDAAPDGAPTPDKDDAGGGIARRSQVAVLRDRLNHALDGAASVRLLWRTDAAGSVARIDADAFSRLGAPVRFDRRTFPDVVQGFDPAGADRLRRALASRATWSGITLDLPVAAGAGRVPMALSGSPVFGPERLFAGFRGFGTVDLGRLDLPAPRPQGAAAQAEPDPEPVPDAETMTSDGAVPHAEGPPPEEPTAPAADHEGSPAQPSAEPRMPIGSAPAAPAPANVVQLRAFQALAQGRAAAPVQDAALETSSSAPPEPAPAPEEVASTDRSPAEPPAADDAAPEAPVGDDLAFLALGEALRARIGAPPLRPVDGATPASPEGPRMQEPSAGPPAPAGPDAVARLLDHLPTALIVMLQGAPVFANAAAAARLGHPAPADLARVGRDLVVSAPSDAGDAVLRGAGGQDVPVAVRRTAVDWGGAAASLWTLAEPGATAAVPEPGGAAEDRSGELLDRVDDAVALLDGTGLVRRLNRRGEGWFGQEGALGQSFTRLLAPESRAAATALLGEVRGQRDGLGAPPSRRDVLARTGEGAPVPMALTLGRLGDAGFYLTLRDVTALKRAETERASTEREQVRDAGRLPGLLGKVSHEIRAPLNAILGFAEVMMDERFGPLGNPRYRDYLKDIHASGLQVMTLVEDLLDLSRIEAGQIDLAVAALDVNRIVAETVAQMQPEAHRERVIMRTSLGGRIPSVLADERSARQIVRNLLSNAVKFNEPGGQVIVSTAVSDTGTVLLRVRDTGVGMTDDEIASALEPFGGLPSPHPANGNGLGLPLTRALVGANGASMAIRSRPQEGTLVEVAFTSAEPEAARLPA